MSNVYASASDQRTTQFKSYRVFAFWNKNLNALITVMDLHTIFQTTHFQGVNCCSDKQFWQFFFLTYIYKSKRIY